MVEVLAHRGWWVAEKDRSHNQNTFESVFDAFQKNCGAEVDVRLSENNRVYISHDKQEFPKEFLEDVLEGFGLLSSPPQTIAIHVKEDTPEMLEQLAKIADSTGKFIFFGLSDDSKNKYADVFGWSRVAYECETGRKGSPKEASKSKSLVIWVAEFEFELTDEDYEALKKAGKKIYQVTPEITGYPSPHNVSGFLNKCKYLTGICTDAPNFYVKHPQVIT